MSRPIRSYQRQDFSSSRPNDRDRDRDRDRESGRREGGAFTQKMSFRKGGGKKR